MPFPTISKVTHILKRELRQNRCTFGVRWILGCLTAGLSLPLRLPNRDQTRSKLMWSVLSASQNSVSYPQMFWNVKGYQPISLLSHFFKKKIFNCISHLLCGGHNLFICTHRTGKSSGQRHDSVPPEVCAVAACLRTAASPLSLRRAATMRKCQRKLKTEVRARARSQSKELERETGTGAWWFKMTKTLNHVRHVSTVA